MSPTEVHSCRPDLSNSTQWRLAAEIDHLFLVEWDQYPGQVQGGRDGYAASLLEWTLDTPLMCKFLILAQKIFLTCLSRCLLVWLYCLAPQYPYLLSMSPVYWSLSSWYSWLDVLLPLLYMIFVWPPLFRPLTSSCSASAWISPSLPGHSWPQAHSIFCLCLLLSVVRNFYPLWLLTLK